MTLPPRSLPACKVLTRLPNIRTLNVADNRLTDRCVAFIQQIVDLIRRDKAENFSRSQVRESRARPRSRGPVCLQRGLFHNLPKCVDSSTIYSGKCILRYVRFSPTVAAIAQTLYSYRGLTTVVNVHTNFVRQPNFARLKIRP